MLNIHKHQFEIPKTVRILYGRGTFLVLGCKICPKSKEVMASHYTWTVDEVIDYCKTTYGVDLAVRNSRMI